MSITTPAPAAAPANEQQLPSPNFQHLLNRDEVAKVFNVDKMTVYKYVESGILPQPIKVGKRCSRWPITEIQMIADARCAGAKNSDVEKIVEKIHADRDARLKAMFNEATKAEDEKASDAEAAA